MLQSDQMLTETEYQRLDKQAKRLHDSPKPKAGRTFLKEHLIHRVFVYGRGEGYRGWKDVIGYTRRKGKGFNQNPTP